MNKTFSKEQLFHIRDQAIIYQCACPAQICMAIDAIRGLHDYQNTCLDQTDTDHAVHKRIKESSEKAHIELEQCLQDVLKLEGWNMKTLDMPEYLQKRLLDKYDN